jgi:hypothetical protein
MQAMKLCSAIHKIRGYLCVQEKTMYLILCAFWRYTSFVGSVFLHQQYGCTSGGNIYLLI